MCTQTDVEQRLQINFNDDADPVAAALIDAAQGHIEREAARALELASHTEIFDGACRLILLTYWPLAAITTVTEDGTVLTADEYTFNEAGGLRRLDGGGHQIDWQTTKPASIEVAYDGGFDPVPADLVDLCAWLAARAFTRGVEFAEKDPGTAGVRRIRLEDREVEYHAPAATAGMGEVFSLDERAWVREAYGRPVIA